MTSCQVVTLSAMMLFTRYAILPQTKWPRVTEGAKKAPNVGHRPTAGDYKGAQPLIELTSARSTLCQLVLSRKSRGARTNKNTLHGCQEFRPFSKAISHGKKGNLLGIRHERSFLIIQVSSEKFWKPAATSWNEIFIVLLGAPMRKKRTKITFVRNFIKTSAPAGIKLSYVCTGDTGLFINSQTPFCWHDLMKFH